MVLAALYYLFLALWAGSTPPHVVQNIASLLPYWLIYILLLLNTGLCLWQRLPAMVRQVGTSRRWSALGTYLFHCAFFLLAAGFFTTLAFRHETKVRVAMGEEFTGAEEQFASAPAPGLLSKQEHFVVDDITPVFWRDQMLFTNLEADLTFADGTEATTRINRPLWLGWGTFLRLTGFGYAPVYELLNRNGRVIDSAVVKMNVFPPGQRDRMSPRMIPHRLYLEVYPDMDFGDERVNTRTLNLVDPGILLHVQRGKLDLGRTVLRPGELFEFEGLGLRFVEIRYWGEFTVVFDPGAPVIFIAFLLGLSGLGLSFWGNREAEA